MSNNIPGVTAFQRYASNLFNNVLKCNFDSIDNVYRHLLKLMLKLVTKFPKVSKIPGKPEVDLGLLQHSRWSTL